MWLWNVALDCSNQTLLTFLSTYIYLIRLFPSLGSPDQAVRMAPNSLVTLASLITSKLRNIQKFKTRQVSPPSPTTLLSAHSKAIISHLSGVNPPRWLTWLSCSTALMAGHTTKASAVNLITGGSPDSGSSPSGATICLVTEWDLTGIRASATGVPPHPGRRTRVTIERTPGWGPHLRQNGLGRRGGCAQSRLPSRGNSRPPLFHGSAPSAPQRG